MRPRNYGHVPTWPLQGRGHALIGEKEMGEKEFYLRVIESAVEQIQLAMNTPNPKKHKSFIEFQLAQINRQVENLRNLPE
jgi:hypothetical protein